MAYTLKLVIDLISLYPFGSKHFERSKMFATIVCEYLTFPNTTV